MDPYARIKEIKDDETKDIDDRVWTPEKIKEDIIDNKKKEEIIFNKISKLKYKWSNFIKSLSI